jgi:hypothetical protein
MLDGRRMRWVRNGNPVIFNVLEAVIRGREVTNVEA